MAVKGWNEQVALSSVHGCAIWETASLFMMSGEDFETPFALSLSKGSSFLLSAEEQGVGFDRLSPNGVVLQFDQDRP